MILFLCSLSAIQYAVFVLPKHFVDVLRRWIKAFWVYHFTQDCEANETVVLPQANNFLQYKLNGIQLLMYVLFISIVWSTFQYNFICTMPTSLRSYVAFYHYVAHYAQATLKRFESNGQWCSQKALLLRYLPRSWVLLWWRLWITFISFGMACLSKKVNH